MADVTNIRRPRQTREQKWKPKDRIVLEPERREMTGFSRVWWYKLESRNEVPRRIKLSTHRVGWLLSEIEEWLARRAALRDEQFSAEVVDRGGRAAPRR